MKNAGVLLLTGGMLLTLTSPALADGDALDPKRSESSSKSVIEAATNFMSLTKRSDPITADPNVKLTFTMTAVRSEAGPATKLAQEVAENAKKDAAAAEFVKKIAAEKATENAKADDAAKAAAAAGPTGSTTVNKLGSASAPKMAEPVKPTKLLSEPLKVLNSSSAFGLRVSPITGAVGEFHRGQDYSAACGTEVFAAAGGTVTYSEWHPWGGGNRVEVDHGNGLVTTYNHLSASKVKVGQKVERGELIALVGTTGSSTGCHLHFEVEVNDNVVDPLPWL
jgi:murein DD-endopeptidase MepM/ murein hydrolase activator NlpD